MATDPERLGNIEDDDPVVLAYRVSGWDSSTQIVRVKRSELKEDENLFEIPKSLQSTGYDLEQSLNSPLKVKSPANIHVRQKIESKLLHQDAKRRIKKGKLTLENLAKDLSGITSVEDFAAQQILMLVTNELIQEGLWVEESQDLTMSEAFPLSQAQVDSRMNAEALEYGTFLEDSDLTYDDLSGEDLPHQLGMAAKLGYSTSMIANLMRAAPKNLEQQIARKMIESNFFEIHSEYQNLYPCCYLVSKGVTASEHFDDLMETGLNRIFPHYTFENFKIHRRLLKSRINALTVSFFDGNFAVKNRMENGDTAKIWARFYQVWNNLTAKQFKALELVFFQEPKLTHAKAADTLGIDTESLKSRLQSAIRRFKAAFPELEGVTPESTPRKRLTGALTHNGLWRYETALMKACLYRLDAKTGAKIKIEWPRLPKKRKLDLKTIARIKAEIIESCPVPHFQETEYFDGMKPTILSFSRKPGNI